MSKISFLHEKDGTWFHYNDPFFFIYYSGVWLFIAGILALYFWFNGDFEEPKNEPFVLSPGFPCSTWGNVCSMHDRPEKDSEIRGYSTKENSCHETYGRWTLIKNNKNEIGWVNCYLRAERN